MKNKESLMVSMKMQNCGQGIHGVCRQQTSPEEDRF